MGTTICGNIEDLFFESKMPVTWSNYSLLFLITHHLHKLYNYGHLKACALRHDWYLCKESLVYVMLAMNKCGNAMKVPIYLWFARELILCQLGIWNCIGWLFYDHLYCMLYKSWCFICWRIKSSGCWMILTLLISCSHYIFLIHVFFTNLLCWSNTNWRYSYRNLLLIKIFKL